MKRARAWTLAALLLCVTIFTLCSVALIPYPGLHNDEVFFSRPIYQPEVAWYSAEIGPRRIPLMVMSYTGALKTWIYQVLLIWFLPGKWLVRLPMVLLGLGTLLLTWNFTRRIAGRSAALITLSLLATDATFIMTNTFDWGPVALQHLLLMAGLASLRPWLMGGRMPWLALAFFCWGLGAWDKALMAWPLLGMLAALAVVWPKQALERCRPKPLAVAALSFALGAAPLIWFNVARPGETASRNTKLVTSRVGQKLIALRQGIDGSSLWAYMVNTRAAEDRRSPVGAAERFYAWLARRAGVHYSNWMLTALLVGLGCVAVLIASPWARLLLFLLTTMVVAWLQMALNDGTGGAPHHVVLLWPFPAMLIGIATAKTAERFGKPGSRVLIAATALFCTGNLLNVNEYLFNLSSTGPTGVWTDAIDKLQVAVRKEKRWIGALDWGFLNGLQLGSDGQLQAFVASDQVMGDFNERDRREFLEMAASDNLYIRHTDDKEVFRGVNRRFLKAAADAGYSEQIERIVTDSAERPVFVLFHLVKTELGKTRLVKKEPA